jgi:hypothetical protein
VDPLGKAAGPATAGRPFRLLEGDRALASVGGLAPVGYFACLRTIGAVERPAHAEPVPGLGKNPLVAAWFGLLETTGARGGPDGFPS